MSDLFLSKVTLKRDSPDVFPLIAILQPMDDTKRVAVEHKMLWSLLSKADQEAATPETSPFLWRKTSDDGRFLVLGPKLRDDSSMFDVQGKPFAPVLTKGQKIVFDLRLNPTVHKVAGVKDGQTKYKRVDVAMDLLNKITKERSEGGGRPFVDMSLIAGQAVDDWLRKRGEENGYVVDRTLLDGYRTALIDRSERSGRRDIKLGVFDVGGILEIVDPERFMARVRAGFGRGKAFGCGLLLFRRYLEA